MARLRSRSARQPGRSSRAVPAALCLWLSAGSASGDPCLNCPNSTLIGVRATGAAGGMQIRVEITLTPLDATLAECRSRLLVTAQGASATGDILRLFPPQSSAAEPSCLDTAGTTPLVAELWFPSLLATCPLAISCPTGCSPFLCIGGSARVWSSARTITINTVVTSSVGSINQYLDCCGRAVTERDTGLELGLAAARAGRSMRFTATGPDPRLVVAARVVASPCGGVFTCEFGDPPQGPLSEPAESPAGAGSGGAAAAPSFIGLALSGGGQPLGAIRGRITQGASGLAGSMDLANLTTAPDPVTGEPITAATATVTVAIPAGGVVDLDLSSVTQSIFSGDIDGDGAVTLADLSILCGLRGVGEADARYTLAADADGSGIIDEADVAALLPRYAAADLNGDGAVDAADAALARPCDACPADVAGADGTPGPDGQLNNGDFAAFFASFFAGCDRAGLPCALADIARDDAAPRPDGAVTNGDFSLFFASFFGGCG